MTDVSAEVIADSITSGGQRLTSIQVTFHRFVLAEFNTHCVLARNSASSRAIPVGKQLARFMDDPAVPLVWPCEQPGMSGGTELEGEDLETAQALFTHWNDITGRLIDAYLKGRENEYGEEAKAHTLHKSLLNRLMEPMQWHTALVTATAWENFFFQRCHPAAQPEMRAAAEAVREAMENSTPVPLQTGEYHLPYVTDEVWAFAKGYEYGGRGGPTETTVIDVVKKVSTARCARTSYMTQQGTRDPDEDLTLYSRLLHEDMPDDPMHASPMEHVATPAAWNHQHLGFAKIGDHWRPVSPDAATAMGGITLDLPIVGKFLGWMQYRHEVEFDHKIRSFR